MFLNVFNPWCLLKWGVGLFLFWALCVWANLYQLLLSIMMKNNWTFCVPLDKYDYYNIGKQYFFPSPLLPSFPQLRIIALFLRSMYKTCACYWCGLIGIRERWDGETHGCKQYPWYQDEGGTSANCKVQYISDKISRAWGNVARKKIIIWMGQG